MKNDTDLSRAVQQYAEAYSTHYKAKDLQEALRLYEGIMNKHPDTLEAEYSRVQIRNIVKRVVPLQEIEDAQVLLAHAHLEREIPHDVEL